MRKNIVDSYVPDRGDIIRINFSPTSGREQHGGRPALVLSPQAYNHRSELAVVCPITNTVRNFPFEVPLPKNFEVTGVVLADQLRSVAWAERDAKLVSSAPIPVLTEVIAKVETLIL